MSETTNLTEAVDPHGIPRKLRDIATFPVQRRADGRLREHTDAGPFDTTEAKFELIGIREHIGGAISFDWKLCGPEEYYRVESAFDYVAPTRNDAIRALNAGAVPLIMPKVGPR